MIQQIQRLLAVSTLPLFFLGCDGLFGIGNGEGPEREDHSPEELREALGQLEVTGVFEPAEIGGIRIMEVSLAVRNPGEALIEAKSDGCPWYLRMYADASLSGAPVWEESDRGFFCTHEERHLRFTPGDQVLYTVDHYSIHGDFLRGGELPPGTYYFTAELRLTNPKMAIPGYYLGAVLLEP